MPCLQRTYVPVRTLPLIFAQRKRHLQQHKAQAQHTEPYQQREGDGLLALPEDVLVRAGPGYAGVGWAPAERAQSTPICLPCLVKEQDGARLFHRPSTAHICLPRHEEAPVPNLAAHPAAVQLKVVCLLTHDELRPLFQVRTCDPWAGVSMRILRRACACGQGNV